MCNAGTLMWWSTRECGSECKWWAARGHLLPHRLRRGRLWSQLRGRPPGHTGHPLLDIGHKIDKAASVLSVPAERSNLQKKLIPFHFHNKRGRLSTWFSNHLNQAGPRSREFTHEGTFLVRGKIGSKEETFFTRHLFPPPVTNAISALFFVL